MTKIFDSAKALNRVLAINLCRKLQHSICNQYCNSIFLNSTRIYSHIINIIIPYFARLYINLDFIRRFTHVNLTSRSIWSFSIPTSKSGNSRKLHTYSNSLTQTKISAKLMSLILAVILIKVFKFSVTLFSTVLGNLKMVEVVVKL